MNAALLPGSAFPTKQQRQARCDDARRVLAVDRRQYSLPGQIRLAAAISVGPAIGPENNGIARTCGRNEKLEISGGAVRLPACKRLFKQGQASFQPVETGTSVDLLQNQRRYGNTAAHQPPSQPGR